MNEVKRRREAIARSECICASGKLAGDCCFTRSYWHKEAANLGLCSLSKGEAQEGCYLAALGSCDGGLSGEHLISKSVMRLLAGDGDFTIGGTPWLAKGEFKSVGFNSLTAKCLCQRHNSNLHPLDDAALYLFASLRSMFEDNESSSQFIVSGHDVERWLLKTLKAMAVSKNLGRGRDALDGEFSDGIDVSGLLDDVEAWRPGTGLYCVMAPGEQTQNHNRFQLAPITTEGGTISGLWANILGISFVLMLEPLDLRQSPQLYGSVHRPGAITVSHPKVHNTIFLSWSDDRRHRDTLSLKFLSKVSVPPSG